MRPLLWVASLWAPLCSSVSARDSRRHGEQAADSREQVMAYGGAKTALLTISTSEAQGVQAVINNQVLIYIALSFGLSLLVNAWVFYRITGGLFNPAITLALFLCGGLSWYRAVLLAISQTLAGIAAAALLAALTPFGGAMLVITTLGQGVNVAQGLFIEAFLTAVLVLTVLFLAVEKHKGTYLAPIGIGLTILACHLFGVVWTGCGINPARAFGPSVVEGMFPGYHWIYWLGPILGSLVSVGFYKVLLMFDYTSVAFAQDASAEEARDLEKQQQRGEVEGTEKTKEGKRGTAGADSNGQESDSNASSHARGRGRVIMVQSRKDYSDKFGKGDMKQQVGNSVVVDLDDADFYECDTDDEDVPQAAPRL